jgi:hypothetical protein
VKSLTAQATNAEAISTIALLPSTLTHDSVLAASVRCLRLFAHLYAFFLAALPIIYPSAGACDRFN